jgi:hypothetical protein
MADGADDSSGHSYPSCTVARSCTSYRRASGTCLPLRTVQSRRNNQSRGRCLHVMHERRLGSRRPVSDSVGTACPPRNGRPRERWQIHGMHNGRLGSRRPASVRRFSGLVHLHCHPATGESAWFRLRRIEALEWVGWATARAGRYPGGKLNPGSPACCPTAVRAESNSTATEGERTCRERFCAAYQSGVTGARNSWAPMMCSLRTATKSIS